MSMIYTFAQINAMAVIIAARIKELTTKEKIVESINEYAGLHLLTDAEKQKLAALESSRFLGTFTSLSQIPIVNAVAGSYADVDSGGGEDTQRYIFDSDKNEFVLSISLPAGETSASIKQKYEANADTNAFTDVEKQKLTDITYAANIDDFTTALDTALNS